jgi:hypothetical protein
LQYKIKQNLKILTSAKKKMKLQRLMKTVADAQNFGGKLWRKTLAEKLGGKHLRKTSAKCKIFAPDNIR